MSVLQFKKRKAAELLEASHSPIASKTLNVAVSPLDSNASTKAPPPPPPIEAFSYPKCGLQALADLCEALRKQEEEAHLTSNTLQESSAIADECLRKYLNNGHSQDDPLLQGQKDKTDLQEEDDESTEYEEIDLGGEGMREAGISGDDDDQEIEEEDGYDEENQYYKLRPQYSSIGTNISSSTNSSQRQSNCYHHKTTSHPANNPNANNNTPHFLYPDIPRILKRDVRRKYSFMFANVMNSYNSQLVDGFLRKFAADDLIYYTKVQIPGITGRDFDVLSLEGIDAVSAFLCSLQQLFPDFLLQIRETKMKQTLPSLETRVISRFRFSATFLYDLDVLTLGALIKRGFTLSCSSNTCPLNGACPVINSINSMLNTSFHHCQLLKKYHRQYPCNGKVAASTTARTKAEQEGVNESKGEEEQQEEEEEEELTHQQKENHNKRQRVSPITKEKEEEDLTSEESKGESSTTSNNTSEKTSEELNNHMKLRSHPKSCELEGVLYFQINDAKKIQKIVFVGKKQKPHQPPQQQLQTSPAGTATLIKNGFVRPSPITITPNGSGVFPVSSSAASTPSMALKQKKRSPAAAIARKNNNNEGTKKKMN